MLTSRGVHAVAGLESVIHELRGYRVMLDSELARRLNTSVPQLYRLLSVGNSRKSMTQLISLLRVLGCEVDVIVRDRGAAA